MSKLGQPEEIHALKSELVALRVQEDALAAELATIRGRRVQAESRLEVAVNAPLSSGEDPTKWLPDEVMIVIILALPFDMLWCGRCSLVCRRWRTLLQTPEIRQLKWARRWEAYASGWISPRKLLQPDRSLTLTTGPDGSLYSGLRNGSIGVTKAQQPVRLLLGHTQPVIAIAVSARGMVFSASIDETVRSWTATGDLTTTLAGPQWSNVCILAVSPLGDKLYTGSRRGTDRADVVTVWSTEDWGTLYSLRGHTDWVCSLEIARSGQVFTGSADSTIRAWSPHNGSQLRQARNDFGGIVTALAVGLDGKVYSTADNGDLFVWTARENGCVASHDTKTTGKARAIAVGRTGLLFAGWGRSVLVRSAVDGTLLFAILGLEGDITNLVVADDGTVYTEQLGNILSW